MASFKRELATGVFYTSLAKYSGVVIQLVITAVLARMLKPEDFGVIALATVFIHFFNTLTEAGIGPAIIQKKDFIKKDYDALFLITALLGIVFSFCFFLISPVIGQYYGNDVLSDVCKWLSILVLFSSLDIVPNNLLLKQKRFDIIAYRTVIIQIICGLASICVAYSGWGVYSLLLSAILSKILIFAVNYYRNPLKFAYDFSCLKGIKGYSTYQFLFNMVRYLGRNLDKIIVGKMMGMNLLGFYEKSYRLMMLPLQNITFVVTPVLQPLFSDLQNDMKSMGEKYLKLLNFLAYISFPLTALLFFNARELIFIVFGDQWELSVAPFRILTLSVEIQILQSTTGAIFQSANYTKGLFWGGNVSFIITLGGLIVACFLFESITAVAASFVITNLFGVFFIYYLLLKKMGICFMSFFKLLYRPALLMFIVFFIMGLYCCLVSIDNVIVSFFIKSLLMLITTLCLLQMWDVVSVKKIFLMIISVFKK